MQQSLKMNQSQFQLRSQKPTLEALVTFIMNSILDQSTLPRFLGKTRRFFSSSIHGHRLANEPRLLTASLVSASFFALVLMTMVARIIIHRRRSIKHQPHSSYVCLHFSHLLSSRSSWQSPRIQLIHHSTSSWVRSKKHRYNQNVCRTRPLSDDLTLDFSPSQIDPTPFHHDNPAIDEENPQPTMPPSESAAAAAAPSNTLPLVVDASKGTGTTPQPSSTSMTPNVKASVPASDIVHFRPLPSLGNK